MQQLSKALPANVNYAAPIGMSSIDLHHLQNYFNGFNLPSQNIKLTQMNVKKQARRRMTPQQKELLEARFQENSNWSMDLVQDLAQLLNLSSQKVYKWNWDRKQKELCEQAVTPRRVTIFREQGADSGNTAIGEGVKVST